MTIGSTTTVGSGALELGLPTGAVASAAQEQGIIGHDSTGFLVIGFTTGGAALQLQRTTSTSNAGIGSYYTGGISPAAGTIISLNGIIEIQ